MILDEVLNEEAFNKDDMVDIFVEGFLYALEMQENGQKAQSIEELSKELVTRARDKAYRNGARLYMQGKAAKGGYNIIDYKLKSGAIHPGMKKIWEKSKEQHKEAVNKIKDKLNKVRNQYIKFRDKVGGEPSAKRRKELEKDAMDFSKK